MPRPESFDSIPLLDLSLANDPETEPQLLSQLRHALVQIGFLYVEKHGVPQHVIDDMTNSLPQLFNISADEKAEVALSKSPHFLGYSDDGSEMTAGRVDRREQFELANELMTTWSPGLPLCEKLRGPNQWPSAYPNIRPIIESYINEMTTLGERFLRLVAKALSLREDTFLPFLSDQHRLKLVRYPGVPDEASDSLGVGAHKDSSGWWTFLLQASPPHIKGLQVLNKCNEWVDVPNIPGTFVVNIGQAFEVVTNGICKATTHRVLSGPSERYSIPFFQGVRRNLTKAEAVDTLKSHFERDQFLSDDTEAGKDIDSAFLQGKYDTWGESQLRTKIRSHRDVAKRFYADVYNDYINDD